MEFHERFLISYTPPKQILPRRRLGALKLNTISLLLTSQVPSHNCLQLHDFSLLYQQCASVELFFPVRLNLRADAEWNVIERGCDDVIVNDVLEFIEPKGGDLRE